MKDIKQRAFDTLDELQWSQKLHDDHYHTDISNLRPQDRLKHLMLHLTKYVCRLTPLVLDDEKRIDDIKAIFIDSFIIALSMANVYSMKLSNNTRDLPAVNISFTAGDAFRYLTECSVGENICEDYRKNLMLELIGTIGVMAKALEAWDHLENFPYHSTMKDSLVDFYHTHLRLFAYFGINHVPNAVMSRLRSVEVRHPFDEEIQEVIHGKK